MQGFIAAFLILSGIAALAYQLVWVRLLGYVVGGTSAAVSTVLAAFFLGLAAGNALAPRLLRTFRPWRVYGLLECCIGIAGLASLFVLPRLPEHLGAILGASLFAKFVAASGVLLFPTLCMGATFPVLATLATSVRQGHSNAPQAGSVTDLDGTIEVGTRLGQLYALNTVGAVLGAACAGFWWIPAWGLNGTVLLAAALNLLVAVLALVAERSSAPMSSSEAPSARVGENRAAPLRNWALTVLALTGFVSIASEVGWSKYLAIFAGGTVFGFAMILIVVLVGIATGSWLMQIVLPRVARPASMLAVGLALLGTCLLLSRTLLTFLPSALEAMHTTRMPGGTRMLLKFASVFGVLILPTLLFGALFPLSLSLYCGNRRGVRAHVGPAVAVNTVFAVAGSLVAGFWIVPVWGTNALLTVTAMLALPLALALLRRAPGSRSMTVTGVIFVAAGLALAVLAPGLQFDDLLASVHYRYDRNADREEAPHFLEVREGRSSVISLATYDERIVQVQNNGLKESLIDLQAPQVGPVAETLLGIVPVLLHEDPHSCFVVGWGGGATVRALERTNLESIRVVEIERGIVEAVRALLDTHSGLDDPRLRLDIDDARFRLLIEKERYDLIVSQPSHPWIAGSGAVFTREFFTLVRSRLRDGGLFGQWINLFNMDQETLCSLQATFFNVFPYGFTILNLSSGDLLLFGSARELRLEPERLASHWDRMDPALLEECCDMTQPLDLLRMFGVSRRQAVSLCEGSPHNTDLNLRVEMHLASLSFERLRRRPADEDPYAFLDRTASFDLAPFVGADSTSVVYALGKRAALLGQRRAGHRAVARLRSAAPALADSLAQTLAGGARVPVPSPSTQDSPNAPE